MKDKNLYIRCTVEEKRQIQEAAKKHGFTVSQYIRWIVRKSENQEEK